MGNLTVLHVDSSKLSLRAGALEALLARPGVEGGESLGVVSWEVAGREGPATLAKGRRSSVLAAPKASSRLLMSAVDGARLGDPRESTKAGEYS